MIAAAPFKMLATQKTDSQPPVAAANTLDKGTNNEAVNVHEFKTMEEAKRIIEAWRYDYNEQRPHSSLGNLTPNEFVKQGQKTRS